MAVWDSLYSHRLEAWDIDGGEAWKETLAIGLLMRDTGQSVKVKSHSSPFIALRLVIQRAVEAEHVLVEPAYGRGSVLVGFSLSCFYSTCTTGLSLY